jgi:hypothetical protein
VYRYAILMPGTSSNFYADKEEVYSIEKCLRDAVVFHTNYGNARKG